MYEYKGESESERSDFGHFSRGCEHFIAARYTLDVREIPLCSRCFLSLCQLSNSLLLLLSSSRYFSSSSSTAARTSCTFSLHFVKRDFPHSSSLKDSQSILKDFSPFHFASSVARSTFSPFFLSLRSSSNALSFPIEVLNPRESFGNKGTIEFYRPSARSPRICFRTPRFSPSRSL